MDFWDIEASIRTKKDFIQFIKLMKQDFINNKDEWEHWTIDSYLDAMAAWASDTGLVEGRARWSEFAKILYAGSRYE